MQRPKQMPVFLPQYCRKLERQVWVALMTGAEGSYEIVECFDREPACKTGSCPLMRAGSSRLRRDAKRG